MDRFLPLTPERLDPTAAELRASILTPREKLAELIGLVAPDGSLRGPFDALLRSPAIGEIVQGLGASLRSESVLPATVCEAATLAVVAARDCTFEVAAHRLVALQGRLLSQQQVEAIVAGEDPADADPEVRMACRFARELLVGEAGGQETVDALIERFGERGVVELTTLVSYYLMVCMLIRACAPRAGA
jgi:4-carboxymuconolactone decarboxylase